MRGHLRKRGRKWYGVVSYYNARGERKLKWIPLSTSKRESERQLARIVAELQSGQYVDAGRLTVAEYLRKWLQEYARNKVTARTYERYEEIVEKHLIPALGGIRLSKLSPIQINTYYANALENGRRDGQGGLAPKTVLQHHRVLHRALTVAVKWGLLARNPADAVDPPKPETREMIALTEEQTVRLLKACEGTPLYVPVVLAVTCGLRRGEILALRWQDVDLEAGTLSVRRSLEETRSGLRFKEPKTHRSRRPIALPPLTVEVLKRHRHEQRKVRVMMGPAYQDNDLVCAGPDGRPLRPDYLTQTLPKIAERSGLPRIRFHDLRHTHASILLRYDVHPKVVSERLGHSRVNITLDLYSHVMPDLQKEAAERTNEALKAAFANLHGA